MTLSPPLVPRARGMGAAAVVALVLMTLAPSGATAATVPTPDDPAEPSSRVTIVREGDEGAPEFAVVETDSPAEAARVAETAEDATGVVAAEVDTRVHALDHPAADDPLRPEQWNMDRLMIEHAWERSRGAGTLVAVIDTGVDASHPDLAGAVVAGVDYVGRSDGRIDPEGHGTHVAGIVAARSGNGIGVVGVAPAARVLPMRVLDETGAGWSGDVAQAIQDSVDRGARVVNLSLGDNHRSEAVAAAVQYAIDQGVLVVAASGNQGYEGDPPSYPGAQAGVLAVAATTSADRPAGFSTAGGYVGIAAPGQQILSSYTGSTFTTMSGTSMATPHVTGVAAAVLALNPRLRGRDVLAILEATADDLAAPGVDPQTGHGLVDPVAALARAGVRPGAATPVSADVDGDDSTEVGWVCDGMWVFATDGGALRFRFGRPTDVPITGDWDGDGRDGIGVVRDGRFFLRQTASAGGAQVATRLGRAGDRPVTGSWAGGPRDGIGVVRGNTWYLRTAATASGADTVLRMGRPSDVPVAGDWAGDGVTRPGVVRDGRWYLGRSVRDPRAAWSYAFGRPSDRPFVADVDGDGVQTAAVARGAVTYQRQDNGPRARASTVRFPV